MTLMKKTDKLNGLNSLSSNNFNNASNSTGASTNTNQSIKISNNKENRRQIEKIMTYRLLSIRLIENRHVAETNKELLMQIINRLETRVSSLNELIEKRENKETQIRLSESAKIYLDESLTLHNENNKAKGNSYEIAMYYFFLIFCKL
jgi:hypothetical protein